MPEHMDAIDPRPLWSEVERVTVLIRPQNEAGSCQRVARFALSEPVSGRVRERRGRRLSSRSETGRGGWRRSLPWRGSFRIGMTGMYPLAARLTPH
jgi:hypothetical protein